MQDEQVRRCAGRIGPVVEVRRALAGTAYVGDNKRAALEVAVIGEKGC